MDDDDSFERSQGRRRKLYRWLTLLGILLAIVFVAGELFLRFEIGLGDPAIVMADSRMHYRYVPSQTCDRLHHLIHYNDYSMRSDDMTAHKTDSSELRVLMIGDSVINGGSMMDQSQLVSALLQKSLADELHRPVIVGNASAGGWGPPSELGWLQTFGLLDADVVVLVVSSHDFADVPTWPVPIGPSYDRPTSRPLLAWGEFFQRYATRLTLKFSGQVPVDAVIDTSHASQSDINWCFWCIERMVQISHAGNALVIVAQHAERQELGGVWKPGHAFNEAAAQSAGADRIVQFEPTFRISRDTGRDPYRSLDNIHPNAVGHQLMAEELRVAIEQLLEKQGTLPHGKIDRG